MTKKEINNVLKTEVILLKKESEQSFFETIFSNWISIFSVLYFFTRKKIDSLIISENRIKLIIRNKVYIEQIFTDIKSLNYNENKSTLEINDHDKQFSIPLKKLRITYEESNLIKHQLTEFITNTRLFT